MDEEEVKNLKKTKFTCTWIQQQQKLHANVIANIKLQLLQFILDFIESIGQLWYAKQSQTEQIKLLAIMQRCLVGQIVVQSMM